MLKHVRTKAWMFESSIEDKTSFQARKAVGIASVMLRYVYMYIGTY